ncbi:MAG: hypothetical protein KAT54_06935 [Candidatus Marinimicrobia bacterium]|nr:hypothetical protein [Candidatus Neomarinimicrobiota bacterium]
MKRYCLLLVCLLISLQSYVYGSDNICKIVLNNGDVFTGEIISQTEETITVKTEYLTVTLKNSDIKSIEYNPLIQENYKYVTVKKYDNLPVLLLTISGGIFAYTQFDKSKEHKNIADAYGILGLTDLEKKDREKSDEYMTFGIISSLVSALSFFIAITPTEEKIPVRDYSFKIKSNRDSISFCYVKHF